MPQWDAFVGVALVLTVVLLVLARQSQSLVEEYATEESTATPESTELGVTTPAEQGPSPLGPGEEIEDVFQEPGGDRTEKERTDRQGTSHAKSGSGADEVTDRGEFNHSSPSQNSPDIELTARMLLANVAVTQGLVVFVLLVAAYLFAIPAPAFGVEAGPLTFGLSGGAVGIALGLVLWIGNELTTTVADAVGATYDERVRELLAPESVPGWGILLVGVLPIIATGEELLFRAALIGVPAAGFDMSPWVLALVSSLAFALGHGAQGRVGIAITGVLGFALAGGYIVTGSLLVVVVAHYLINAIEFLVHETEAGELSPQW